MNTVESRLETLQSAIRCALPALGSIPAAVSVQAALETALDASLTEERLPAFVSCFNLPYRELGANVKHAHPAQKAKWVKRYRRDCAITFGVAKSGRVGLPLERASLVFDWYLGDNALMRDGCYYPRDRGNAQDSLKAAIDALVDAGILIDDNAQRVLSIHCNLLTDPAVVKTRAEIVVRVYKEA